MTWFDQLDWLFQSLSEIFNVDSTSLQFFITLCLTYPVAGIYLLFIAKKPPFMAHIYFIATGTLLLYWNFTSGIVHLFFGIMSTLTTLHIFGPSNLAVALTFALNMTYLLAGYHYMNCGTYDINWTMPYCVLCLRLIGLAWDYRDGSRPVESLSEYQKSAAFKKLPSVLETVAFCLLPTACFAGPQFTLRHYQSFVNQTLRPQISLRNLTPIQKYRLDPKMQRTLSRLFSGIACIGLYVICLTYLPVEYMVTEEFLTKRSFVYRLGYICAYSNFMIMRYLAVWLIGEGACVFLGLGCTGRIRVEFHNIDKHHSKYTSSPKEAVIDGFEASLTSDITDSTRSRKATGLESKATCEFRLADTWDNLEAIKMAVLEGRATVTEEEHTRCANISLVRFHSATNTEVLISAFNINTNKWMLEYLYKRLRCLGSKTTSHILTLTFLALWHGFYSGYYVNFFLEFVTVYAEKQFLTIVHRSIYANFLYQTLLGKIITTIIGKLHVYFLLSSPLVAFSLLRASLWIKVFNSVYWIGFIYLLWPLAAPLVKKVFPPKPHAEALNPRL